MVDGVVGGVDHFRFAVGEYHADGKSLVAEEGREAGYSGGLHLEVGDAQTAVGKILYLVVLSGVGKGDAQLSALWAIETSAGDGDAAFHIVLCNAFEKFRGIVDAVRVSDTLIAGPSHVVHEGCFEVKVTDIVASGVEVEETVETEAFLRCDEGARGQISVESAAGADAYEGEGAVLGAIITSGEVNVGKGIKFVDHDVYVVASDASALHGDPFREASACGIDACYGAEFAVAYLTLSGGKM